MSGSRRSKPHPELKPAALCYAAGFVIYKRNEALFPKGKEGLEVYEWTTDWTEYFDEGHEWWGTLCLTVYDKLLDRMVVIMASATD